MRRSTLERLAGLLLALAAGCATSLAASGRTQRTFFIWEGVTMYLPEGANRDTLRFIRQSSTSGSSVVFDYVLPGALDATGGGLYGAKGTATRVAERGEPWLSGWSKEQTAALVSAQGLVFVSDLGAAEMTARYLIGSDGRPDGRMGDYVRYIHARVP